MTEIRSQLNLFDFNLFITILLKTHNLSYRKFIICHHLESLIQTEYYIDSQKDSQLDLALPDCKMPSLKYGAEAVKIKWAGKPPTGEITWSIASLLDF